MAYIGKTPTVGNFQVCDAISVVNGQAAYTLQVGGSNVEPESANAEDSAGNSHDFLSNGFKLRTSSSADVNGSGDTMIYMAFAESPFVNSNGIPTNAR